MMHFRDAGTVVLTLALVLVCSRAEILEAEILGRQLVERLDNQLAEREETLQYEKRANTTTIPAAISIGPSQYWDGNDGPWSSFPLQIGGGQTAQNVRVFPSTVAYNIFTVSPAGCPSFINNCNQARGVVFNPNQSLTWVRNSIWDVEIEVNLGLDTTADAGFDTVTLGFQGSGGPKVEHTTIFNVGSQNFWLGLFGLNPQPTNFTDLNAPQISFMQTLYDKNSIPSRSYGYTAGNQYRLNKVFGSLTLGGYDENRFSGGVQYGFYQDVSRDLLVNIKSISSDGGTNLLPGGQIAAFVDSTVAQMYLPISACQAFEKAFGLTYNSSVGLYLLNASTHDSLVKTNPTVTFTLTNGTSDVSIVMPYGAFNLNVSQLYVSDTQYYFPLKQAANDTQYTLGRVFLQEAYLIADYDRSVFTIAPCTWDQAKINQASIKSILSPNWTSVAAEQSGYTGGNSKNSGLSAGAIAGIVIGVVVLVLAVVAIIFFIVRRKRRGRLAELDGKGKEYDTVDAKVDPGNELGAEGERSEMPAPHVQKAQEMDSPFKMDPNRHGYVEVPTNEHYGPGKGWAHEVDGQAPIFEMQGSDVQEMPVGRTGER